MEKDRSEAREATEATVESITAMASTSKPKDAPRSAPPQLGQIVIVVRGNLRQVAIVTKVLGGEAGAVNLIAFAGEYGMPAADLIVAVPCDQPGRTHWLPVHGGGG